MIEPTRRASRATATVWGIVLAAGSGSRFGTEKQFAAIGDQRLVDLAVRSAVEACDQVVLVLPAGRRWDGPAVDAIVEGGSDRPASVRRGLAVIPDLEGVVVVHQAANPLASPRTFAALIAAVRAGAPAAVPGLRPADVVRRSDGQLLGELVGRDDLVLVQTPAAFRIEVLRAAHRAGGPALEDTALVTAAGYPVHVLPGDGHNIHVATPADLELVRALAPLRSVPFAPDLGANKGKTSMVATNAADHVPEVATQDLAHLATRLDQQFRQMAGSELLITGGAGFLGYYLVQAPLAWNRANPSEAPIRVTVHDKFIRGIPAWLSNLVDPSLRLVERDVLEPLPPDEPTFDYIVHAASLASPTYYRRYPIETMDANVQGLRLLLDHAAGRVGTDTPVRGLLFFSTSEIYGDPDPDNIPTAETYRGHVSCTGPRACYDESKRYGETLCVNFAKQRGVPVSIVRPFNNFGPGLRIDDRRVVPDFARDILEDRDIVLLSDGSASRTFCYVADAVDGYYRVLVDGRPGEPYNIGTDQPEISMRGLAERFAEVANRVTGYTGKVVVGISDDPEYLTDNPNRRCPVIDKARSELGYEPQITLEDGLERALRWYIAERKA